MSGLFRNLEKLLATPKIRLINISSCLKRSLALRPRIKAQRHDWRRHYRPKRQCAESVCVDSDLVRALKQYWDRALDSIRNQVTHANFTTYFEPLRYVDLSGDALRLQVDDPFFGDWVRDHYLDLIKSAASTAASRSVEVKIEVAQASFGEQKSPALQKDAAEEVDRPTIGGGHKVYSSNDFSLTLKTFPINPDYTFQTFVVGDSNQFASAATEAVANQPGHAYNPLFVYGDTGLGKTHLLHGVANHVRSRQPGTRIVYISAEEFTNQVIKGISTQKMDVFRQRYRDGCDLLLMDDVHVLAGKERTQEEFFYTFNSLHASQKQIILTSDRFPQEIPGLEERLRSRFHWGLIADIKPPQFETRVAILRRKAQSHGLDLPDDVAFFLAENIRSNVRELEGGLVRLGAYASLTGRRIDLELARESLKTILHNRAKALTIDSIQKLVAEHFDVKVADLRGQSRRQKYARPRRIAMYLCRKHTQASFPQIGEGFGGKDHSTVITACKKVKQAITADLAARSEIETLERKLPL